jgi:predicted  nucleic acid-binding Zn-ribbon protein
VKVRLYTRDGSFDQTFDVTGPTVLVGRHPSAGVRVPDEHKHVSRKHATLHVGSVVEDLKSANGTRVAGVRIETATPLTDGSFEIGDPQKGAFVVQVLAGEPARTTPLADEEGTMQTPLMVATRSPEDAALRQRCSELERAMARLEKDGARAQTALETARTRAGELEARCTAAEAELAALKARPVEKPAPVEREVPARNDPRSVLVEKLERRCAALEEELQRARAASEACAAGDSQYAVLQQEIERLKAANAVLRQSGRAARGAGAKDDAAAGAAWVRKLVESDPKQLPAVDALSAEEFMITGQFVCFRGVEKFVTLVARELEGNIDEHTILPHTGGQSFIKLARALFEQPGDADARRELRGYFEVLGRWLAVGSQAQRIAAAQLLKTVRQDLTEASLAKSKPLSSLLVGPLAHAELWQRTQEYLRTLSDAAIEGRVEEAVRTAARTLLDSSGVRAR